MTSSDELSNKLRESFDSLYYELSNLPLPLPRIVSPRVLDSIESIYTTFSIYPRPLEIDFCPCCISQEEIKNILNLPLRELTPRHLYRYASSVLLTHGYDYIEDFKYFLPRILELMVYYWECLTFYPSPEIILDRLKMGEWESWDVEEKNVIVELLDSISEQLIASTEININELGGWIEALSYCFEQNSSILLHISRLKEPQFKKKLVEFCQLCHKCKLEDDDSFDEFAEVLCVGI